MGSTQHSVETGSGVTPPSVTSSPILKAPEELLALIALECGPSATCKLARTCRALHAALDNESTWKLFLACFAYPGHAEIQPAVAKETCKERYCKACDSIVGPTSMFYTGNLCISCMYKTNDQRLDIHCLSRVQRRRYLAHRAAKEYAGGL